MKTLLRCLCIIVGSFSGILAVSLACGIVMALSGERFGPSNSAVIDILVFVFMATVFGLIGYGLLQLSQALAPKEGVARRSMSDDFGQDDTTVQGPEGEFQASRHTRGMTIDEQAFLRLVFEKFVESSKRGINPLRGTWKILGIIGIFLATMLPAAFFKFLTIKSPQGLEINPIAFIVGFVGLIGTAVFALSLRDYNKKKMEVDRKLEAMKVDLREQIVEVYDSSLKTVVRTNKIEAVWESPKIDHNMAVDYYSLIFDNESITLKSTEFFVPEGGFGERVKIVRGNVSKVVLQFSTSGKIVPIDDRREYPGQLNVTPFSRSGS